MATQMDTLIEQATERVAHEGDAAKTQDLILAGFGWLAQKIGRCENHSNGTSREIVLRVGLPAAALGTGLGTFLWALIERMLSR